VFSQIRHFTVIAFIDENVYATDDATQYFKSDGSGSYGLTPCTQGRSQDFSKGGAEVMEAKAL